MSKKDFSVFACMQPDQRTMHASSSTILHFVWRGQVSHWTWNALFLLHWMASLPQEAFCLHFFSLAVEVWAVDVCVACTLSPEPLSLPQILKSTLLIPYSGNWTAGCTSYNRVLSAVVHAGSELSVQNWSWWLL